MPIHPALWLFKQLHMRHSLPEHYVAIRLVHNLPGKDGAAGGTEAISMPNVRLSELVSAWETHLEAHLCFHNYSTIKPYNVYYGINPRLNERNKKQDCLGFVAFYLDLDTQKGWTKEMRLYQIGHWKHYGLYPSIVIDSGNGYHAYWLLTRLTATQYGERVINQMIDKADAAAGGNVQDVTRIFRLPGFNNVKRWYENNTPACHIIEPPQDTLDEDQDIPDERCFDPETIENYFPSSTKADIEKLYEQAKAIGRDAEHDEICRAIAEKSMAISAQQRIHGAALIQAHANVHTPIDPELEREVWVPSRTIVPPLEDINFGKGYSWLKKYCSKGYEGLTEAERAGILEKIGGTDDSASAFDAKLVYRLISQGYTFTAVQEFWNRGDMKIYREHKDANYLSRTYDEMLNRYRMARTQNEAESADPIIEKDNQTFIRDGEQTKIVLTGNIEIKAKYVDDSAVRSCDQEWFELKITTPNPINPDQPKMYDCFTSVRHFNRTEQCRDVICRDTVRLIPNQIHCLQHLLVHLERKYYNAPRFRFSGKIIYSKEDHSFVFPYYTITKDAIKPRSLPIVNHLQNHFEVYKHFEPGLLEVNKVPEFLQANWDDLRQLHVAPLILSVIGLIGSTAMKYLFQTHLNVNNFHLPAVNICGHSNTGKSETVKKLLEITGVINHAISASSTTFGITRTIELFGPIPMMIDEFKEDLYNVKEITLIRSLIRRLFSGERDVRGRADMGLTSIRLHAPLIVVGEDHLEREGNVAETSRIISIDTNEYTPAHAVERYLKVTKAKWNLLAPHFYQHLLSLDTAAEYVKFEEIRMRTINLLRDTFGNTTLRVSHNVATLWYGCSLWDSFLEKHCPGIDTLERMLYPGHHLLEHLRIASLTSQQTFSINTVKSNEQGELVSSRESWHNNEFLQLLKQYTEEVKGEREYADHQGFIETVDEDRIYISLPSFYSIMEKFNHGRGKRITALRQIKSILRNAKHQGAPWLVDNNFLKRLPVLQPKNAGYGSEAAASKPVRVIALDLLKMQEANLWPKNETMNENSQSDSQTATNPNASPG